MMAEIVKRMHHELSGAASEREEMTYEPQMQMIVPAWLKEVA